jgi:hypothetical protein
MQHKLVNLCFVGLFPFYLGYRFHLTNKFDEATFLVNYWLDNKKWYNIKEIFDATIRSEADHEMAMANNTYTKGIKKVYADFMIPSKHWIQLGCQLGEKKLGFFGGAQGRNP